MSLTALFLVAEQNLAEQLEHVTAQRLLAKNARLYALKGMCVLSTHRMIGWHPVAIKIRSPRSAELIAEEETCAA